MCRLALQAGILPPMLAMLSDLARKRSPGAVSACQLSSMIGTTAAVVTGVWTGAGTDPKGQTFDTSERWMDVFVNQGGQWKCVASQATTIKQ